MNDNHVKEQIRTYLLENFLMGGKPEDIQDDTSFIRGHVLDSMGFFELIAYIEESFGIHVEDEEMVPSNLDSLENIAGFLARKETQA